MWVYTCSACGDQSEDSDQGTAAAAFEEHARTVHNPTLLVTFTEPLGSERADFDGFPAAADPLSERNGAVADALKPVGGAEDDLFDREGLGLVGVAHAPIIARSARLPGE